MATPSLVIYTITAFFFGFFAAALFIRWLVSLDRRMDDGGGHADDYYPDMRRALHYIRQEMMGILGALIIVAGFLAAIIVVLIVRR